MKTKIRILVLLLAAGIMGAAQAATTGNLTFNGLIEGGTCNLDAGDVNRTITLPTKKLTDFGATGHSNTGNVTFDLTARCDVDVSSVTFAFVGIANPADPNRYINSAANGAQGVGLWFYSRIGGTNTTIQPNGNNTRVVTPVSGVAVLPLGAAYYTTVGWPLMTRGDFKAEITVNITYN